MRSYLPFLVRCPVSLTRFKAIVSGTKNTHDEDELHNTLSSARSAAKTLGTIRGMYRTSSGCSHVVTQSTLANSEVGAGDKVELEQSRNNRVLGISSTKLPGTKRCFPSSVNSPRDWHNEADSSRGSKRSRFATTHAPKRVSGKGESGTPGAPAQTPAIPAPWKERSTSAKRPRSARWPTRGGGEGHSSAWGLRISSGWRQKDKARNQMQHRGVGWTALPQNYGERPLSFSLFASHFFAVLRCTVLCASCIQLRGVRGIHSSSRPTLSHFVTTGPNHSDHRPSQPSCEER